MTAINLCVPVAFAADFNSMFLRQVSGATVYPGFLEFCSATEHGEEIRTCKKINIKVKILSKEEFGGWY